MSCQNCKCSKSQCVTNEEVKQQLRVVTIRLSEELYNEFVDNKLENETVEECIESHLELLKLDENLF